MEQPLSVEVASVFNFLSFEIYISHSFVTFAATTVSCHSNLPHGVVRVGLRVRACESQLCSGFVRNRAHVLEVVLGIC